MPFYEAVGHDTQTRELRTLQVSARDDLEAIRSASDQGIMEVKLRQVSDREVLMMDMKCFLNADSAVPAVKPRTKPASISPPLPRSILLDHPILVITGSVFAALMLNRLAGYLLTLL
jgi:hypothetical protein